MARGVAHHACPQTRQNGLHELFSSAKIARVYANLHAKCVWRLDSPADTSRVCGRARLIKRGTYLPVIPAGRFRVLLSSLAESNAARRRGATGGDMRCQRKGLLSLFEPPAVRHKLARFGIIFLFTPLCPDRPEVLPPLETR